MACCLQHSPETLWVSWHLTFAICTKAGLSSSHMIRMLYLLYELICLCELDFDDSCIYGKLEWRFQQEAVYHRHQLHLTL